MKLAIAGDSAGEGLAKVLADHLKDRHEVHEISRTEAGPDAFYANLSDRVASAVAAGEYDRAILVCGTGIGISIAANKVHGVRAALVHDDFTAAASRAHNDANVIALGARVIGPGVAESAVRMFRSTPFVGGRHQRRVDLIETAAKR